MHEFYNCIAELIKLGIMLIEADIPFTFEWIPYGGHIIYSYRGMEVCSVIEGLLSEGFEENTLEIMGLLTKAELKRDYIAGYLTAEDVFQRINSHYQQIKFEE